MRQKLCLNGEWDFMPVYNVKECLDIPSECVYEREKIRVPSSWKYVVPGKRNLIKSNFGVIDDFEPFNTFEYPEEWSYAETGVYHRTFTLSRDMLKGCVFLGFNGLSQMARIALNGIDVAVWDEMYLPVRVDVTDMIKRDGSENDLVVICTTFDETVIAGEHSKTLGLVGSWFGAIGRGIWQDVFIESCPLINIEDLYVNTSVREETIKATVTISNKYNSHEKAKIKIIINDSEGISKVIELDEVILQPGKTESIALQDKWVNPVLWMPDNPHLYNMQAVLLIDGEKMDSLDLKFGFREIWIEGSKFMLNGIRINLRGDSWHFQGAVQQSKEYALNWYRMCMENGINYIRLHAEPHPEYYLDAADETGMLIMDETAIYGSGKSMAADNIKYIGRCKKHVERLVKRDRNHPSIMIWSLQNEMRWVDGRDVYKKHIPELLQIIKEHDDTRPVILEGDNRLIAKEAAEIESMHYNIDGTIGQWDRKRPLIFGEHGGWWYICPQNSSAYSDLKTYQNVDDCAVAMAVREKLFIEYARRNDVSGITTFNFVHYLMESMPEDDVEIDWDRLDTPGCKPKIIRKHSLTMNNGLLKDYPMFKPNKAFNVMKEAYKPVTIIPTEYNTSFFDDKMIQRSFDVYNDTLYQKNCRLQLSIRNMDNDVLYEKCFEFLQGPAERENVQIEFNPPKVGETTVLSLVAILYHNNAEVHRLNKKYKLYSSDLKSNPICTSKTVAYWGEDKSYDIIKKIIPVCVRINGLTDLKYRRFDVVIIGSYACAYSEVYQTALGDYVKKGGTLVVLEQFTFTLGDLTLSKCEFFSSHINDQNHNMLEGISDDDLIYWKPGTIEDIPESIIKQCFIKPVCGNFNMLLECSKGEFGDGGDLWTPLLEYGYQNGTVILNQFELTDNFGNIPQACILLRNIIGYAVSIKPRAKHKIALVSKCDSPAHKLADGIGLNFDIIDLHSDIESYGVIVPDLDYITDEYMKKLYAFVYNGGCLLILPVTKNEESTLERLLQCKVKIDNVPTYQLNKPCNSSLMKGLSVYDLFRFDKVNLTPRLVKNAPICLNTIEVENTENLLVSINGTPWFDYYVREIPDEYARIALVDINKRRKKENKPYLVEKQCGSGKFIISQISIAPENEKDIRIYSRMLANLGAFIKSGIFSYRKCDRDYSVEHFMTLLHEDYKDYKKAEEYYSDSEFSLNNLGEGLFGWMKKVEKNNVDGFINIPKSSSRIFFLTCFVEYMEDMNLSTPRKGLQMSMIDIDFNCWFKLWINGRPIVQYDKEVSGVKRITINGILLQKGLNRLVMACRAGDEDIRLRPIFRHFDGTYMDNLKYRLTIDEVDLK